ncbi:HNH endonuclease signature motif containing protein [Ornithinicoccus halotolerans]|uniref:HNH endonuclease signature motif containing protein n=1 Tax=Ornithinicoccus halotolerans TaxID=1748220 RepID=UPI0018863E21|nr:HNH endonuclease signature motif containing protein [Ornithinicoccus halotolerans]
MASERPPKERAPGGAGADGQRQPVGPAELPGAVAGLLTAAREVADSAGAVWQVPQADLEGLLEQMAEVRRAGERFVHALVVEVIVRGAHLQSGLTVAEWLAARCPWLPAAELRRLAWVAQAAREPRNAPVAAAVSDGTVCTERAERLLRCLARVRPYVDEAAYTEYAALLLPLATMGADRELRQAGEHLVALVTPEVDAERLAKARQESCTVYESSLSTGMRRFIIETDPEGAALLRGIFSSELTKPQPDQHGCDLRPAGRRRHDALLAVVRRGMTTPDPATPGAAPVQLLLTVAFDVLNQRLASYGTAALGAGDLECLTAGQLRRLACEAGLVPFVLGGNSEILDHGRSRRLATPAQRRALWVRDRACTFPGCTMPAQWTEVHHARTWWSRGGNTDLADMTLLCRRHHTWVHTHDPELTMTPTGPIWHLDRCHGNGTGEQPTLHTDQPPTGHAHPTSNGDRGGDGEGRKPAGRGDRGDLLSHSQPRRGDTIATARVRPVAGRLAPLPPDRQPSRGEPGQSSQAPLRTARSLRHPHRAAPGPGRARPPPSSRA